MEEQAKPFDFHPKHAEKRGTMPTIAAFLADAKSIAATEALFDSNIAQVELRQSKTGKFVSVSAKEMMMDVDSIIARYEKAVQIEGLMAL